MRNIVPKRCLEFVCIEGAVERGERGWISCCYVRCIETVYSKKEKEEQRRKRTHCLCTVGTTNNARHTAQTIPTPASVQYAFIKMGCRAGILAHVQQF